MTEETYSNLPEEIISDVLSRLPAKSVGVCRCVSKPWRALLSRPNFIKTHLKRSTTVNRQLSLTYSPRDTTVNRQLSLTYSPRDYSPENFIPVYSASLTDARHLSDRITVSQGKQIFTQFGNSWEGIYNSCDGLLLVSAKTCKTFVVNPVTQVVREVPCSPFVIPSLHCAISTSVLGYDSVHDDYKVVSICNYCSGCNYDSYSEVLVSVYSLKSGSWKKIPSNSEYQCVLNKMATAVHVDGCIHWFAKRMTDKKPVIMGFDLGEERLYEVPSPDDAINADQLDVLGGRLCVQDDQGFDLWVMEEYGVRESWTKITIDHPGPPPFVRIVCSFGEEVVIGYRGRLAMYNLKRRTSKYLEFPGHGRLIRFGASFVGSLVSPCSRV